MVVEGNGYFPPPSLHQAFFKPSGTTTVCPWKGTANCYSVDVDGEVNKNAARFYPELKSAALNFAGHTVF